MTQRGFSTEEQAREACARIMAKHPRFHARPALSRLPGDSCLGIALDVGGGDTWWSSEAAAMRYAGEFL